MSAELEVKEIAEKLGKAQKEHRDLIEKNNLGITKLEEGMEFLKKQATNNEKKYSEDPLVNDKIEKLTKTQNELTDKVKTIALKYEAEKKYNTIDGLAETFIDKEESSKEYKSLPKDYYQVAKSILDDPHKKELKKSFMEFVSHPTNIVYQQKYQETTDKIKNSDTKEEDSYIKKSLSTIVGEQAGYLAPPEFDLSIQRVLFETSPLRSICTVMNTMRSAYKFLIRTTLPAAVWGNSELEVTETDEQKYGMGEIPVNELKAQPIITLNQLDDSVVNIEQELRNDVAEAFMLAENKAFIKGAGGQEPLGLEYYAKKGKATTSAEEPLKLQYVTLKKTEYDAADGSYKLADALLNLEAAVLAPYKRRAYYLMSRAFKNLVRQVKDKNNQYLFSNFSGWGGFQGVPKISDGLSGRVNGYSILECDDLPSFTVGNFPVYFGNFTKFKILDRIGLSVIIDNVTTKGFVKYFFRKRCGAGFVLTQGVKSLRIT